MTPSPTRLRPPMVAPLLSPDARRAFLDFFKQHGHTEVASASLVPHNDPTLLFTNAGMNQFKDYFTGKAKAPTPRATSSQKCVRAGGKHNDLENVGRTARHHTFFEMLGNFSFGDYFKPDAIAFAYQLLTGTYGIDAKRLIYTVHESDAEARVIWKKVAGVGDDRIISLGDKDNFWAMGETGPCGPCSEIHYFQGADIACAEEAAGGKCLGPACDCDRWVEIWNLVFMQFDQVGAGRPPPAAQALRRHRDGARTALRGVAGRALELRDRSPAAAHRSRGRAVEEDVRPERLHGHQRVAAGRGRPRARRDVPDRGRRLSREDRPRVRAAADHAAGRLSRLAAGHQRAVPGPARRGRDRKDARRLPGGGRARQPDREDHARRGGPLPRDAGARRAPAGREAARQAVRRRPHCPRAAGVHAVRHVRLPAGPDARHRRAARLDRRRGGVHQPRWTSSGGAASSRARARSPWRRCSSRSPIAPGRRASPGYEATEGTSRVVALLAEGQETDVVGPYSKDVAVIVAETPFYGEQGGQVGDAGTIASDKAQLLVRDCKRPVPTLWVHLCDVAERRAARGRHRQAVRRRRAARRHPAQPLGDAPAALGAAPRAGHARHAEGLAGGARIACASTFRTRPR